MRTMEMQTMPTHTPVGQLTETAISKTTLSF